ncbi:MAG: flagellar biosynthesis anti-sigma factor FlgM [Desulfobacteraceae bacterium 4572_89]|nr:MAG: flagellar biosynthesis anti-sigma factor FlgM [Desulfobacteraceae bacterium 4572_89]
MKISSSTPNYMPYTNQANPVTKGSNMEKAAEESKTDSINLSQKTIELQKISAAMDTEPADRKKMVSDLKQQVQANQYNVNAEQVAERMMGDIIDSMG